MINSNDKEFHLNDVDTPLIRYLFIDSPIMNYKNVNKSIKAKITVFLVLGFLIMYFMRMIIVLVLHPISEMSNYFGDILILFGDVYYFFNILMILIQTTIISIYYLFHFSSDHNMKWFVLLSSFRGIDNINELGIKSKKRIQTLVSRFILVKNILFKASFNGYIVIVTLYIITYYYSPLNNNSYLYPKIFWVIGDIIYAYFLFGSLLVVYIYYYLVCYKIKLEIIDLRHKVDSVLLVSLSTFSLSDRTIIGLLNQMAQIIVSTGSYNRFWKQYLRFAMFPSIPAHAMLLYLFISYKMNLFSFVVCVDLIIGLTLYSVFIFIPLLKINSQLKSLYKSFYQLLMCASLLNHSQYEKVLIIFLIYY